MKKNLRLLLLMVMIVCVTGGISAMAQNTEKEKPRTLGSAEALMKERRFDDAKSSIQTLLAGMPAGWKAVTETGDKVFAAYWDQEHFAACAAKDAESKGNKRVSWVQPSYSKAYYLLAYMAAESRDTVEAKRYIDKALELEPDHPTLLCEKGMILHLMGAHEESVGCYGAVIHSRRCATNYERARALRGQGVSLIDLGRLDEAEKALKESLQIAPGDKIALNELEYIRRIRSGASPNAPSVIYQRQK